MKQEGEENENDDLRDFQVNTSNQHYAQDYTRDSKSSAEIMLLNEMNKMAVQSRKGNQVNEASQLPSGHLHS
jgi:hypothetical protein